MNNGGQVGLSDILSNHPGIVVQHGEVSMKNITILAILLLLAGCSVPSPNYEWVPTKGSPKGDSYFDSSDCNYEVRDNRPRFGILLQEPVNEYDDDYQRCMREKGWLLKLRTKQ